MRRAVLGLKETCGASATSRLAVIFCELVTNAIRHAGISEKDTIEVILEIGNGTAHGRVIDPGRGFDPGSLRPRDDYQEGGFGLKIVDELAARWGVELNGRTEVWFEL